MLSALRSPTDASRILILAAREGAVFPLASVAMMLECEAVLCRPDHLAAMALTAAEVGAFLDHWAALIEPVVAHFSRRPTIRDADDEIFVEAAANGAAEAIVTFNVSDYRPADDRQALLGIEVCRPGDILRRLTWRPTATTLSAFRLR